MIFSMTGFGRDRFEVEGAAFDVEVRSVTIRDPDTGRTVTREVK